MRLNLKPNRLRRLRYLVNRFPTLGTSTGRFEAGQYIVEPPPEIARRQIPIRVAAVRIKVN